MQTIKWTNVNTNRAIIPQNVEDSFLWSYQRVIEWINKKCCYKNRKILDVFPDKNQKYLSLTFYFNIRHTKKRSTLELINVAFNEKISKKLRDNFSDERAFLAEDNTGKVVFRSEFPSRKTTMVLQMYYIKSKPRLSEWLWVKQN